MGGGRQGQTHNELRRGSESRRGGSGRPSDHVQNDSRLAIQAESDAVAHIRDASFLKSLFSIILAGNIGSHLPRPGFYFVDSADEGTTLSLRPLSPLVVPDGLGGVAIGLEGGVERDDNAENIVSATASP